MRVFNKPVGATVTLTDKAFAMAHNLSIEIAFFPDSYFFICWNETSTILPKSPLTKSSE